MANVKITDLPASTDPVSTDVLPIVDVSADATKKVSIETLLKNASNGTESAPSFSFDGDGNTGIYHPAADQVAISTNGVQRILIEDSGVTIPGNFTVNGTTTTIDTTTLVVEDKNIEIGKFGTPTDTTADGGGITLKGSSDKTIKWVESTGCWTFNQPMDFNNHVRIDSLGRVGIGETSMDGLLVIKGNSDAATTPSIRLKDGSDTREAWITNTAGDLILANGGDDNTPHCLLKMFDGNIMTFATANAERMRIDGSGNVLIGKTTTALTTAGSQISSGFSSFSGDSSSTNLAVNAGGAIQLANKNSTDNNFSNIGGYNSNGLVVSQIDFINKSHSSRTGEIAFLTHNGSAMSERLRIDSAGNVGIGTSSPSNQLDVLSTTSGATVSARVGSTATTGANNANLIINNGGTGNGTLRFDYESATNRASIGVPSSTQDLFFTTAGSERMRIDSSGRVRIGASSFNDAQEALRVQSTSGGTDTLLTIKAQSNSGKSILNFGDSDFNEGRIIYSHSSNSMEFRTDDTERMRIDSSGRLLVGTSSAFGGGSSGELLQVGFSGGSRVVFGNTSTSLSNGALIGQIDFNTKVGGPVSTGASIKANCDGTAGSGDAPSKLTFSTTAHGASSPTTALTIDSAGRLLAGTSSTIGAGNDLVVLKGTAVADASIYCGRNANAASISNGNNLGLIKFGGGDGGVAAHISGVADGTWSSTSDCPGRLAFSTTTDGASSPTERMRIGNNGQLSSLCSSGIGHRIGHTSTGNDDNLIQAGKSASGIANMTTTFFVKTDGDVQNVNNSYTGISDIKLKENIVDANSQWSDIKALQVRNYNFKADTGFQTYTQLGLVAQEVELVSPGLVSEFKDTDGENNDLGTTTKSVNYSVLYMKAVKALQEAMERIETLETKVAALEAG